MSFSKIVNLVFIFSVGCLSAQTFDLEQSAQLIRPRIKLDSRYTFDSHFTDTTGTYRSFENYASTTFPIKRSFKLGVNLNLKSLKVKDIVKNSVSIKAYEILGTFRVGQRQATIGFDSVPQRTLYNASAGIIGLHLTKKFRILFYNANVYIQEENKTIPKTVPRFSGMIGQYHIRGMRKCFFYGVTFIQSDGIFIPTPFIGGTEPLTKHLSFNYTLPVQLNLQYKGKKTYAFAGVKADGYRSGIWYTGKRSNLNVASGCAYLNYRYNFTKTFQMQIEGGYNFYQLVRFDKTTNYPYSYPTKGSPYANITLNMYLGKSLIEKIVEQVF